MTTDLTRRKVQQDLINDINYYNSEIAKAAANRQSFQDDVTIENLTRQRDERQRELSNVTADDNEEAIMSAFDPFK